MENYSHVLYVQCSFLAKFTCESSAKWYGPSHGKQRAKCKWFVQRGKYTFYKDETIFCLENLKGKVTTRGKQKNISSNFLLAKSLGDWITELRGSRTTGPGLPMMGLSALPPGSHNEVHNQKTQISLMWLLGHSSFFLILGPGFLFGPFHLDLSLPKIWLLEAIHANSCHGICISHWLAPGKISTTITLF